MRSREEQIKAFGYIPHHYEEKIRDNAHILGFITKKPYRDCQVPIYTKSDIYEAIQIGRELERAEMGRDAARLDWIGNQDVIIGEMGDTPPYWQRVFLSRYQITLPADLDDIRHSIDAAMNAENGQ